jgi:hypothetical protein
MEEEIQVTCTAFEGSRRIASGALAGVVAKTKRVIDRGERAPVLVFDDRTSELVEVDFRGTVDDVLRRLAPAPQGARSGAAPWPEQEAQRGPGRPRLGVVAHEVTLLPRHWEWLNSQPGGASVTLRKLVDEARRNNAGKDRVRRSQEAAYRFMSAMAGNRPGFEEAARALFAGSRKRFDDLIEQWPKDIKEHVSKLALGAFPVLAEAQ